MSDARDRALEAGPKVTSICVAFDAFRLALGGTPSTFTPAEIILWLRLVSDRALAASREKGEGT